MKKFYIIIIIIIFSLSAVNAQWISVNSPVNSIINCITKNDSNIYVGTYANNSIYYSQDNGINWVSIRSHDNFNASESISAIILKDSTVYVASNGYDIYIPQDNNNLIYPGGLFSTTNNGNSWNNLVNNININTLILSGDSIFAGTDNGVYLSTDNGNNWNVLLNIDITNVILSLAKNGDTIFAGTLSNANNSSGSIYMSTDNGNNWSIVNNGLPTNNLIVTALAINGNKIFAGTYGDGVYLSIDNGTSWNAINNDLTNLYINSLVIKDSIIFVGSDGGGIFFSPNNGNSWSAINTGLSDFNISMLTMNDNLIFAGGYGGGIWELLLNDIAKNDTIITSTNPNIGTTLGSGIFNFGQQCTVKAIPKTGYTFINWTESGDTVSTDTSYTFTVMSNRNLVANFTSTQCINKNSQKSINIYPNPAKDNLIIEINSTTTNQKFDIINLLGETIYTSFIINKKVTINTSDFQSGDYFLKLYTDKETIIKKFIKE